MIWHMPDVTFGLSKIFWMILSPLNLVMILLLAALAAHFFLFRLAKYLFICAAVLFLLVGLTPLGPNLLSILENRHARQTETPEDIAGILILGGIFDPAIAAARGAVTVNDSMERAIEGLRLARLYPQATVVFSGGEGRIFQQGQPETAEVIRWMEQQDGLASRHFLYEDKSRNTWENIKFTMALIKPEPQEQWIVVTSAYHMPRTMIAFEKAGWGNVIAWPVDYRTDGKINWLPRRLDVMGNFYKIDLALHEFAGILSYKMSGNSASR